MKNALTILGSLVILAALIYILYSQGFFGSFPNNEVSPETEDNIEVSESSEYMELGESIDFNLAPMAQNPVESPVIISFVDSNMGLAVNLYGNFADDTEYSAEIRAGICDQVGEVRYNLNPIKESKSSTVIEGMTLASLYTEPLIAVVSDASGTVLNCSSIFE